MSLKPYISPILPSLLMIIPFLLKPHTRDVMVSVSKWWFRGCLFLRHYGCVIIYFGFNVFYFFVFSPIWSWTQSTAYRQLLMKVSVVVNIVIVCVGGRRNCQMYFVGREYCPNTLFSKCFHKSLLSWMRVYTDTIPSLQLSHTPNIILLKATGGSSKTKSRQVC